MRVLLVYSNRTRVLEPVPPIGLSYVATATRKAGHDVRFVDLLLDRDPEIKLREALLEFRPDVVGVSVRNIDNIVPQRLSWALGAAGHFISVVRACSTAKIVVGGPAVSILGGTALERFPVDYAIVGEGEESFPQLLEAIEKGRSVENIEGVCWREPGTIHTNPAAKPASFGPSGMEQWIDWREYERHGGTWSIHTKRGCPMGCIYCNYPAMDGIGIRRRPISDVVDEIEHVRRTINPRTFEFTDSTFNLPVSHAVELCEEIIRRGLKVNLSAVGVNPAGVTEELFPLMKRAGFISMIISADTASPAMLKSMRKGFDAEQVSSSARWARESGIRTTWFFLLGGPGETQETVEETVSFVEEHLNWKRFLTIFMTGVRILPGTELARSAIAEGKLSPTRDLVEPSFYFSPGVSETWVLQRINQAIGRCPTIVHGAEENGSILEQIFKRVLGAVGVPPPYWRFLPDFLRIPPLPKLRARSNGVSAASRDLYASN